MFADRAEIMMRPRPNWPWSSSRNAEGSMIAVPRSIAASCAALARNALQSRINAVPRHRNVGLMPPLTPRQHAYSSEKALHIAVKRLGVVVFGLAPDDQALAGHDHPVAVLAADRVDPAKTRNGVAGVDFVGAASIFDQRAAIADIGQHPAFDRRRP